MREFLKNLRQKPKHIKTRIFVVVMVLASAIVISAWMTSAGNSLSRIGDEEQKSGAVFSEKVNLPGISDSLKASVGALFDGKEVRIK